MINVKSLCLIPWCVKSPDVPPTLRVEHQSLHVLWGPQNNHRLSSLMSVGSGFLFLSLRSGNRGVPLTKRVALYTTVLHYRADCDKFRSTSSLWAVRVHGLWRSGGWQANWEKQCPSGECPEIIVWLEKFSAGIFREKIFWIVWGECSRKCWDLRAG